jgi:hypothetical protein
MAVRDVRAQVRVYPRGAPSYTLFAGQWMQVNFNEIFEAALMTNQVEPPVFPRALKGGKTCAILQAQPLLSLTRTLKLPHPRL